MGELLFPGRVGLLLFSAANAPGALSTPRPSAIHQLSAFRSHGLTCYTYSSRSRSHKHLLAPGPWFVSLFSNLPCSESQSPLKTEFKSHFSFCQVLYGILSLAPLPTLTVEFARTLPQGSGGSLPRRARSHSLWGPPSIQHFTQLALASTATDE